MSTLCEAISSLILITVEEALTLFGSFITQSKASFIAIVPMPKKRERERERENCEHGDI